MSPAAEECVFCGRPIEPGEETAGRAPSVAHASCADAALTDDRHWDAIAAASGDVDGAAGEPAGESPDVPQSPAPTTGGRGAGCLPAVLSALAVGIALRLSVGQ